MNTGNRRPILILLITTACMLLLMSACSGKNPSGSASAASTAGTEITGTITFATTPAASPSPASEASPSPEPAPISAPVPTPASVFIPRETFPGGRLFEEDYYAVLPGEGAYYNVFDSYGKQRCTFLFTDGQSTPPTGLFEDTSHFADSRVNMSEVQTVVPENPDGYINVLEYNRNGYYQVNYNDHVVTLYNTAGKHIRTLTFTPDEEEGYVDIVVACYGEETVVSFTTDTWHPDQTSTASAAIYFVSSDGTINDRCEVRNLPGIPHGLLGRKYFLTGPYDGGEEAYDIYDLKGNAVMKNVSLKSDASFSICSIEAVTYIHIMDYYMKDGQIYDSYFHAVAKNQTEKGGKLIFGVDYDVDGITCSAKYWSKGSDPNNHYYTEADNLVAVGTTDNQIAVKTKDAEYVFDSSGFSYYSINNHVLVLSDNHGNYPVFSLATGKLLYTIDGFDQLQTADEYLLVIKGYYDTVTGTFPKCYIIDKDGNIRYKSQNLSIEIMPGENILLHRGPYVGIADLNGEWIIKTLNWELTRDQDYTYPWEENSG